MKLKEQTSPWPPVIEDKGKAAGLDDIVIRAFRRPGATHGLDLRLQTREGVQYEVALQIPETFRYKAAVAIVTIQGKTLGDIGELDIS